jgi:polar amino acid transport system ATP-binding protein
MQLTIQSLIKQYDQKTVLDDVNINIQDEKVIAFLGASGSGKSTLLRLIAGLEEFQSGKILVNGKEIDYKGKDIDAYRKSIGFVFQDHNLFNHLTVLENICLVLEKVHKRKNEESIHEVEDLLKAFDLFEHRHKLPHQLSGGQSQRVSIVRALSIRPELILLDEPTSSLDPILTYEVLSAVKKLAEDRKDFIIVTHEIGFAKSVADYIVFMEEGKVIEHGPNSILDNPTTDKLKNFLSKVLTFNKD